MAAIGYAQVVANVDDVANEGYRSDGTYANNIHTDAVYVALMSTINIMEERLNTSLENYQAHPDVQANLQQLQYDLQQWNLALTTMTNINKNLGDALNSIASNFR
ncbi:MAG: hypothetical protein IJJ33_16720 [Victivallales bacterium]|nr:hypothetical protein [Victivallales bacterium]